MNNDANTNEMWNTLRHTGRWNKTAFELVKGEYIYSQRDKLLLEGKDGEDYFTCIEALEVYVKKHMPSWEPIGVSDQDWRNKKTCASLGTQLSETGIKMQRTHYLSMPKSERDKYLLSLMDVKINPRAGLTVEKHVNTATRSTMRYRYSLPSLQYEGRYIEVSQCVFYNIFDIKSRKRRQMFAALKFAELKEMYSYATEEGDTEDDAKRKNTKEEANSENSNAEGDAVFPDNFDYMEKALASCKDDNHAVNLEANFWWEITLPSKKRSRVLN
jgi:hypothetical protein